MLTWKCPSEALQLDSQQVESQKWNQMANSKGTYQAKNGKMEDFSICYDSVIQNKSSDYDGADKEDSKLWWNLKEEGGRNCLDKILYKPRQGKRKWKSDEKKVLWTNHVC